MSSNSVSIVRCWTDGPVKLLGVWFGPNTQKEKKQNEITSRLVSLPQQCNDRNLSLKGSG